MTRQKVYEKGKLVGDARAVAALCVDWMEHIDGKLEVDVALNQFLYYCAGMRGSELHDEAVWLLDNGGY